MRDWIDSRLRILGKTKAELARHLELPFARISDLIKGTRELKTKEVLPFAQFFSMSPIEVISLFSPDGTAHLIQPTRNVTVKAHVQAGDWVEGWQWPDNEFYDVSVPTDNELEHFALYGAETRGPSMNKRYPEGSVLVFTDVIETGEEITPGRRYVVERQRADGLREVTVKTLHLDDEGHPWLMPESSDPHHQQPIGINGADPEETTRIVGRVRYAVIKE